MEPDNAPYLKKERIVDIGKGRNTDLLGRAVRPHGVSIEIGRRRDAGILSGRGKGDRAFQTHRQIARRARNGRLIRRGKRGQVAVPIDDSGDLGRFEVVISEHILGQLEGGERGVQEGGVTVCPQPMGRNAPLQTDRTVFAAGAGQGLQSVGRQGIG